MSSELCIFGTGDHAKKIFYTATSSNFKIIAFIDENTDAKSPIPNIPVLMPHEFIETAKDCNLFIAIGNKEIRRRLLTEYQSKDCKLVNIIHPSAIISPETIFGHGVFIGSQVIIEFNSHIGDGSIIDIGAIIDHDCHVPAYSHLRAGEICQPRTYWSAG